MRTQNTVKYGTIPSLLDLKWQNWKEMILNSGEFSACFLLIWVKWSFGFDGGRCWPKNCKSMIKFHYYEEVGWGGRREEGGQSPTWLLASLDSSLRSGWLSWPHWVVRDWRCPGNLLQHNSTDTGLPSVSQLEETNNTERGQGQPGDSELIKLII